MATLNDIAKKYDSDICVIKEMLSVRGISIEDADAELDFDTENLACALLEKEQLLLDDQNNKNINPDLKPYEPPFDYSVDKGGRIIKGCYIAVIVIIALLLAAFFALGEMLSGAS